MYSTVPVVFINVHSERELIGREATVTKPRLALATIRSDGLKLYNNNSIKIVTVIVRVVLL